MSEARELTAEEYYGESERLEAEEAQSQGCEPGWRIRSVGEVDWALERVAQAQRELAELEEQHAAALARLEERKRKVAAPLERTVRFFEGHLRMWAEANPEQARSGKKKSRDFLHGRIGYRAKPLRLEVQDETALFAWANAEGLTTRVADMPAIRARFKRLGEVPTGCAAVGGDEEFYVAAKGGEEG